MNVSVGKHLHTLGVGAMATQYGQHHSWRQADHTHTSIVRPKLRTVRGIERSEGSRPKREQGRRDSNPRPTVLETAALPTELRPWAEMIVAVAFLRSVSA